MTHELVALVHHLRDRPDATAVMDVTRKADRRARAIREGLADPCPDCNAATFSARIGPTDAVVVLHDNSCPWLCGFLAIRPGTGAA